MIPSSNDDTITSWQLRLKQRLKDDDISYRELATRMQTTDAIVSKHLNGQTKQESLTFIKRVCQAAGYSLVWVLFGQDDDKQQLSYPWLNRLGIFQWLDTRMRQKQRMEARYILGWFSFPNEFEAGPDSFIWQVESSELESEGLPSHSWLLIDPSREMLKRHVGQSHYTTVGESHWLWLSCWIPRA